MKSCTFSDEIVYVFLFIINLACIATKYQVNIILSIPLLLYWTHVADGFDADRLGGYSLPVGKALERDYECIPLLNVSVFFSEVLYYTTSNSKYVFVVLLFYILKCSSPHR
jgi:hypothetical protein